MNSAECFLLSAFSAFSAFSASPRLRVFLFSVSAVRGGDAARSHDPGHTVEHYRSPMQINDVSGQVVDGAIRVHSILGPGLLERPYLVCLAHELGKRGLRVQAEIPMSVRYDGVELDLAYRLDLLVEDCVVVEIKAVAKLLPVHHAQLLSQLKLSDRRVGLLINFNVALLKDGIVRMVNRL